MKKAIRNKRIESTADPAAVFERHGLGAPGRWRSSGIPTDEKGSEGLAARLCDALEQLGGLYAAFARFLTWRADLLDGSFISHLSRVRLNLPVVPASSVAATIHSELGVAGAEVAANLSAAPAWNTLSRTAYSSIYGNQPVIVEVARDPAPEERFVDFEKGLSSLGRPELANIAAPSILAQFRECIRSGESLVRERQFLDVLSHHRGETLAEYPRLIPQLSTARILCFTAAEGRLVSELIAQGSTEIPVRVAAAILEQFFSLSMVDADLDLDAMVVDHNHRLHFRRLNNPISVLPGVINKGIEYVSAVLAGNAPLAAQALIRLMISQPPLDLEKQLMEEFSAIEPELKINMWFPASAGAFESNWRALTKMAPSRPLYLDCLHRNLLAAGYWNSDAVQAGAPPFDAISEAQWPVVGNLLRTQFGMLMNSESAKEWAFGSSLLMFGTIREMNRIVEELRENDITVGVACQDWRQPKIPDNRTFYRVILAGFLVLFLASLHWGSSAPEPWSLVLKILAVAALPAMIWAISRIT